MSSHQYVARVCPVGSTPATSDETKEFEFTTDASGSDALVQAATDHILSNRLMDNVSFHRYWEVYSVTRADQSTDTHVKAARGHAQVSGMPVTAVDLRQRLPSRRDSKEVERKLLTNGTGSISTMKLVASDQNGSQSEHNIVAPTSLLDDFGQWLKKFSNANPDLRARKRSDLGDAIIRTAAEVDPAFGTTFDPTTPEDHLTLLRASMDNPNEFRKQLKDVL